MANGKITQVIGTVVDVEFPSDEMPNIFNALETEIDGTKLVLEVEQHVGNNWVRCLALGPTDGLKRGTNASDTGNPISVPVGDPTLGRLFNALGEPIDNKDEVKSEEKWPIHREPPSFDQQATDVEIHAKEIIALKNRLNKIYSKHTKKSESEIKKALERDNFMTPEEAKDFGLIDQVVEKR